MMIEKVSAKQIKFNDTNRIKDNHDSFNDYNVLVFNAARLLLVVIKKW